MSSLLATKHHLLVLQRIVDWFFSITISRYKRIVQDTKYQNLKGKHGKLKEKAASLKGTIQEFETVLQSERAQFKELEEALEDHQSQARRRERQLSNDLVLVTQVSLLDAICAVYHLNCTPDRCSLSVSVHGHHTMLTHCAGA